MLPDARRAPAARRRWRRELRAALVGPGRPTTGRAPTTCIPTARRNTSTGWCCESSPYLLQHAHNPVNWYAWGDEAFDDARRLGRPVFLSVGYSTCHWCHVMEEESFESEEIAAFLNAHYIPVKVDREERPDVDAIYMSAVQALTGLGRLAHERLADPRPGALLRRHLFSAPRRRPRGALRLSHRPA